MSIIQKISDIAEKICILLCVALTIIITFSAFMQVFTRFLMGGAWKWTDEACRYCLVWLAMMGAALGVKRHAHVAIDVVINAAPDAFKQFMTKIYYLSEIILGGVLIFSGYKLCMTVMKQRSSVMHLPMGIVYTAIPILGVFLIIFAASDLVKSFKRNGEEEKA